MEIFLARQGIFDRNKKVIAYEILYRNSNSNTYDPSIEENDATMQVISNIASMGHYKITESKTAFINFPRECLMNGLANILHKDNFVIEILETVEPTKELLEKIQQLKEEGYTIALDDVSIRGMYKGFGDLIDIYKIDFLLTTSFQRNIIITEIRNFNTKAKFLAEKIENEEEFLGALNYGYDYFQGYYFSKPKIMNGKDICPQNANYYRLLKELLDTDYEISRIESIIKSDVSLSFKLIKFLNSGIFGFIQNISSIKQAIMLLGVDELKKWVLIITIKEMKNSFNNELAMNSIIRGKFCEEICKLVNKEDGSKVFIVGLFSFLDVYMEKEMKEIIDELPVDKDIKSALLEKENNNMSKILKLVKAYENMDMNKIMDLCNELGLEKSALLDLYVDSVQWAVKISNNC